MAGVCNEKKGMKRFFVDKTDKSITVLKGEERRHLADVLRARVGDTVILCPNDGKDYIYRITSFTKDSVTLEYVSEENNPTETDLKLSVFCALLKGDKTEFAVQKLTELGVKKIIPFISDYTVQRSEKNDRLQRAAHEASKQCGRAIVPEVCRIVSFSEMTEMLSGYDSVVFAYEGAYADGLRIEDAVKPTDNSVALIVGPEGGFSEKEVDVLRSLGHMPVTLGKRILRAETASVAAAAVIMYICGEWK